MTDKRRINIITASASLTGLILILAMAFDVIPEKYDNIGFFAALVCFIIAGFIRKILER